MAVKVSVANAETLRTLLRRPERVASSPIGDMDSSAAQKPTLSGKRSASVAVLLCVGLIGCAETISAAPAQRAHSGGASIGVRAPSRACSSLSQGEIAAARIELPTRGARVVSTTIVAASGEGPGATPEHCLLNGEILPVDPTAPSIRFRVALPAVWSGRVLMYGGGGLDGSIPNIAGNFSVGPRDKPTPLARGYATFASDSGHQAAARGSLDGTFAMNDEALLNWSAGDALKKTRDVAVSLIEEYYGVAPSKSYFVGGSTGGREALTAIQRWPRDWDGAISWFPAQAGMVALLGGQNMSRALAQPGAYLNGPKREALFKAAVQACDALDGALDGIVSAQARCNARFDPSTASVDGLPLRCPAGSDADNCLSDAQIKAVKAINGPTRLNYLASGWTGHPGYNIWGADTGITSRQSPVQRSVISLAFNTVQPGTPMPDGAPYASAILDQFLRYAIARDPSFNSLSFDPENPGVWADRISRLSEGLDVKADLSGFAAKGGKLLLAHGVHDVLVSSRTTEEYYRRLTAELGRKRVRQFARFYEVPGYGHAASSVFNATWDSLSTLEAWVEQDVAPTAQITVDTVGVPGRSRPLCEYPTWPQYKGRGDINTASSFRCAR